MTVEAEASPVLTEREAWSLLVGEHMINLGITSQLMRHSNPAASVMYIHADVVEWEPSRQALKAVLDFAAWCARGKTNCAEAQRFMAFADQIRGGDAMRGLLNQLGSGLIAPT